VRYPILYLIRTDKPAGWDPVTDAETDEEMMMYVGINLNNRPLYIMACHFI
jgi:hypothetical protein